MLIDKDIIRQRKSQYGSNFGAIKEKWQEHLKAKLGVTSVFSLSDKDVAQMMALMKECRIEAIKEKMEVEVSKNEETVNPLMQELHRSLKDSRVDYANYKWIGDNFKEYEEL